jgi:hypothetical protein
MLTVDTIAKIRRAFFVEKKPIKAICRELKRSRTAVRRAIRAEATEFRYERSVQPMPKLGAWREQLDELLAANEAKPRRERLTLVRIFETLRDLGFDGGYDAVRRYAKNWRKARGRGPSLYSAELCVRRSLPVRLEPRDRCDERRHDGGEGRAYAALP